MARELTNLSALFELKGHYFPAGKSDRFDAVLRVDPGTSRYQIFCNDEKAHEGPFGDLSISSRLGNIERKIYLPDESLFETPDNDEVDELITALPHPDSGSAKLSLLERSWTAVIVGLVVTLALVALFFMKGLPVVAGVVAHQLPVSLHESVSEGVLASLDESLFSESKLSADEQAKQRESFSRLLQHIDHEGFNFTLHVRRMGRVPNAFALPSGDIVITDGLVNIADTQEEIEAVMLHEIAHVLERHGMQHAIEASTITVMITLLLGDVSAIGQLIVAVPAFLLTSSYSRTTEMDADEYAFSKMLELGIDTIHFANIMSEMGNVSIEDFLDLDEEDEPEKGKEVDSKETSTGELFPEYLSSHPVTTKRIQRALELSISRE